MMKLLSNNEDYERFSPIINRATFIGFYTPFVSWAWSKTAEPLKLIPAALKLVIIEDRALSSLLLPFGLIIYLVIVNIFYIFLLNKWKKEFFELYKKESKNFHNAPIKTSFTLIKVTAAVALFGGSAFFTSMFVILR